LHWKTTAKTPDGAAVETVHGSYLEALAAGRHLARAAWPTTGRVRWHLDNPHGCGPVAYYVHSASGRLVAEVLVSVPCTIQHEAADD
jgi:hypothetical protein